ncbi:MAG: hypothetical protein ACOZNI_13790 [Myxococcota bacterium]
MVRLLPLVVLAGCAADMELSKADDDLDEAPSDSGAWADADVDTDADADADTEPPEEEDDYLALAPAATSAYVFVANPTRDTVTRISVPSLAVLTAEVGETPSAVETTSDYTHAVTLNEGDDTVSIVVADTLAVTNVEIRENFNRMSLSGDGQWVLAWYDPDVESSGSSGGVVSFNEVSFVHVPTATHVPMAVGFNPRGVKWSEDGRLALVVSDAALAVVDLTAETLSPTLVDIAEDPLDAPEAEEVELSPDGQYAFVRQFGATGIVVVDLATLAVERVEMGGNPTDMDLSPDGLSVAVVLRDVQAIRVLDATNPFGDAASVSFPSAYGSVIFAGAGEQAILYTNASLLDRYGVWDVAAGTVTERSLVKPVQSMGMSPTGSALIVFHTKDDAADADPDSPFRDEWALTLIDLDDFRTNPMLLPAEPTGYSISDDGKYGFFMMEDEKYLEALVFDTLLYEEIALASIPVFIGVLPETDVAFASQDHELGRISFYDAATDELDTITGFELNSDIEHE